MYLFQPSLSAPCWKILPQINHWEAPLIKNDPQYKFLEKYSYLGQQYALILIEPVISTENLHISRFIQLIFFPLILLRTP